MSWYNTTITFFSTPDEIPVSSSEKSQKHSWRFWAIFPGLCVTSMLCALDTTILSTVLPTITADLHSSSEYVWIVNAYTLTFTAIKPLYGQIADIFGRKTAIVVAVSLFLLGSGVCGGAQSTAMLIGGRAIQGLGGGGLSILPAMIVCDLVPLRKRQKYTGLVYGAFAIGTFIGPVVGGVMVDHIGWRWVFWLNLPLSGVALGLVALFLKVSHQRKGSVLTELLRIDYFGNLFLMGAVTSMLLALAGAGTLRSWSSWQTLVPLLLGLLALPVFIVFEASPLCLLPTVPLRIFSNKTSGLAFLLTFLHGIIAYWATYFFPVYFQAVLQSTPQLSGIYSLPAALTMVPFGIAGGFMIAKTGFVLMAISIGCCSILDQKTPKVVWVILELVFAAGVGSILTSTLPAIQAPLAESDVASSTATWGFIQSLGFVWGVAIPSNIFESKFRRLLLGISDPVVRLMLETGGAYEHASRVFIISLPGGVQKEVVDAFVASLKLVWEIGSAFAILGVFVSMLIKDVELRATLETSFGYDGEVSREGNKDCSKE